MQCIRCRYSPTVSIVSGGHTVVAVSLSITAKKLLVHIDANIDQLRSLSPDIASLQSSHDGSEFKGVIVTIAGGQSTFLSASGLCLIANALHLRRIPSHRLFISILRAVER